VADIAPSQRLHQTAEPTVTQWRDQQMEVVGHQHIGVQGALARLERLTQRRQEEPSVGVFEANIACRLFPRWMT
jgi:hypothetical protein